MGCGCAGKIKIRANVEAKFKPTTKEGSSKINSIIDEIRRKRLKALEEKDKLGG
jgi:hypothetical protein